MFKWIRAIIILPFNVLIIIPALILYFSSYGYTYNGIIYVTFGILFLCVGIFFALWTMFLFNKIGKGTAAPWNPPKNLVVCGPYKYVRNPMISAVFAMLLGEIFILNAPVLFYWFVIFVVLNVIYIPFIEEKTLEKLYSDSYLKYKQNVPRWIPKLTFHK